MDIAVIGLGDMGLPIAGNLVKNGHRVVAFDLSAERADAARARGIEIAESAAAAAANADIVHVVVFTDDQLRDVVIGSGAVLDACRPGAVLVVHSTVRPGTCTELAAAAAEHSVEFVDAGMTGAVAMAEAGTLTLLVGGSDAAIELCRPEFGAFASTVVHLGAVGAGVTGKVLNNMLVMANAEALREMIELASRAGIDENAFLELVRTSTARSWVSEFWTAVRGAVTSGGDPHYAAMSLKDSGLAVSLAADLDTSVPVIDVVAARLAQLT